MKGIRGSRLGAALAVWGVAAAGTVRAQVPAPVVAEERAIHVTGLGEVEVQPDQAHLLFAVETAGATARDAGQRNAQVIQRVIAALVAAGVPRDDIETQNYTVNPEYEHDDRGTLLRIRGYRVLNQLRLETQRMDQVGALIDAALGAGANRMDALSFGVRDPQAAQAAALAEAVSRARASAETIARSLGVALGPVLRVSTVAQEVRPVPVMMARMEAMDMAAPAPPTPIQPGEQRVQAQVTVSFGISGR